MHSVNSSSDTDASFVVTNADTRGFVYYANFISKENNSQSDISLVVLVLLFVVINTCYSNILIFMFLVFYIYKYSYFSKKIHNSKLRQISLQKIIRQKNFKNPYAKNSARKMLLDKVLVEWLWWIFYPLVLFTIEVL